MDEDHQSNIRFRIVGKGKINGKQTNTGEGFFDMSGNYLAPKYADVRLYPDSFVIVTLPKTSGRKQIVSVSGKLLTNHTYIDVTQLLNKRFIFYGDTFWTLISRSGQIITDKKMPFKMVNDNLNTHHLGNLLLVSNQGKRGLINYELEEIIPVKFDSLNFYNFSVLCKKGDSSFIYNLDGKLMWKDAGVAFPAVNFRADYYFKHPANLFRTDSDSASFIVFVKYGKYGLVSNDGKLQLPAEYDKMGRLIGLNEKAVSVDINSPWAFWKNGKVFYFRIVDRNIRETPAPLFVQRLFKEWSSSVDILKPSGEILAYSAAIKQIKFSNRIIFNRYLLYKTSPYSRNRDSLLGSIDVLGNSIVRLSGYAKWSEAGNGYFVQNGEKKCGYIDCRGKPLLNQQYDALAISFNNRRVWYYNQKHISKNNGNLHYEYEEYAAYGGLVGMGYYIPKERKSYWKFIQMDHPDLVSDSFDSPFEFGKKLNAVSRDGLWGLADASGKVMVEMNYKCIRLCGNGEYILQNDSQLHIWYGRADKASYKLLKPDYDAISEIVNNKYFAIKNNLIYLLNSQFNVIDSTTDLLSMTYKRLKNWIIWDENNNYRYDERAHFSENNLAKFSEVLKIAEKLNIGPDYTRFEPQMTASIFPSEITWIGYRYNHYLYFKDYRVLDAMISNAIEEVKDSHKYMPRKLTLTDLVDKGYYIKSTEYFRGKTLSLANKSDKNWQFNLFFDTIEGIKVFSLHDLIADSLQQQFTNLIAAKWKKLDDPNLPCIKEERIFEYFKNRFYLQKNDLILLLSNNTSISIPLETAKKYFRDYWKGRL